MSVLTLLADDFGEMQRRIDGLNAANAALKAQVEDLNRGIDDRDEEISDLKFLGQDRVLEISGLQSQLRLADERGDALCKALNEREATPATPDAWVARLEPRITALDNRVYHQVLTDLEPRMAALEGRVHHDVLIDLKQRMAALKGRVHHDDLTDLKQRMAALEAKTAPAELWHDDPAIDPYATSPEEKP